MPQQSSSSTPSGRGEPAPDGNGAASTRAPPASASAPSASGSSRSASGAPGPATRPPKNRPPPPAPSSGAAGAGAGGARPRSQSNVGARLLKKRQSVAYSQHPALFATDGAPGSEGGAPAVPALPPGMTASGAERTGGPSTAGQGSGPEGAAGLAGKPTKQAPPPIRTEAEKQLIASGLDVDQLASDAFKPEDFLKQNLPSSRANGEMQMADLRKFKSELDGATKITETGLQKSVFDNYADFIVISKEIATLESEMLELKGVLEEWRAVPELLEGGTGDEDWVLGAANTPTRRNSIADLATLHKSQLSALWENVEGAQKLVTYVPGRHIITEAASFVELHPTTYKPKQSVHLFLLNDAMLVCQKKNRGAGGVGGPSRLVAERCFTLSEIVVVDLKDTGDLQNAIKIKRGKETVIYRTDKPENKKMLLLAFKKVAEELINRKRKEMLNEAEARKGDPSSLRGYRSDFDSSFADADFDPVEALGLSDSSTRDSSWIGDFSDELSVAVSVREFENAVSLIERAKSILPQLAAHPHISQRFRSKLDDRTDELVSSLLHDLSNPSIRKSGVVRTTNWLLRLGLGERARETFLSARGVLVKRRTRQIKFEGDISMYISELAMVSFTLIKNTCEWYMAAFKDNSMASGFVRWASEQVEVYAETFRRQVYGVDQDGKVVEESLEMTKAHGAMLRDVGLDFTFLFDSLLGPERPKPAERTSSSRLQVSIQDAPSAGIPGGRSGGGGGGNGGSPSQLRPPTSAVAIARKSIYQLQSEPNAGDDGGTSEEGGGSGGGADRAGSSSPEERRQAGEPEAES
ncbi:hypothetical protein JCM8202_001355 [Rhodotorula sphaerocarpa]